MCVVGESSVAVGHAPKEEGVMLRESECLPFIRATGDGEYDGHTLVLRMSGKSVNRAGKNDWILLRVNRFQKSDGIKTCKPLRLQMLPE